MKTRLLTLLLCGFCSFTFAASEKLTVALDVTPNPDHAPLFIAQQQGFFKAEGLDVEFIIPKNATDPIKLVAEKKANIGLSYEPDFIQHVDRGFPIISIGTLVDQPLDCLIALNDNDTDSLNNLKGKTIGTNNALSSAMLKIILTKQGLTDKDIKLVTISNTQSTEALLSHKVDFMAGATRNIDVPALELHQQTVATFFPEDYGIPNYNELIFISNTDDVKDKRFPRFLRAIQKAVAYLDAHPKETWQLFIKQYPQANNVRNRNAWFATMPYFAENPAYYDSEAWKNFAEFMQTNGFIKKAQPVSRYAAGIEV